VVSTLVSINEANRSRGWLVLNLSDHQQMGKQSWLRRSTQSGQPSMGSSKCWGTNRHTAL